MLAKVAFFNNITITVAKMINLAIMEIRSDFQGVGPSKREANKENW